MEMHIMEIGYRGCFDIIQSENCCLSLMIAYMSNHHERDTKSYDSLMKAFDEYVHS